MLVGNLLGLMVGAVVGFVGAAEGVIVGDVLGCMVGAEVTGADDGWTGDWRQQHNTIFFTKQKKFFDKKYSQYHSCYCWQKI